MKVQLRNADVSDLYVTVEDLNNQNQNPVFNSRLDKGETKDIEIQQNETERRNVKWIATRVGDLQKTASRTERVQSPPARSDLSNLPSVDITANLSKPIPKDRLETFIDGVFAVALTLLVVNLAEDIPNVIKGWEWVQKLGYKLMAFVYSFWVVGIFWITNHNELNMLVELGGHKQNSKRTRMREFLHWNLLLLLFIVFVPFSAALLGNNIEAPLDIAANANDKTDWGVVGWAVCYLNFMQKMINWTGWGLPPCHRILGPGTDAFLRMRVPFLVYAINLFLISWIIQRIWSYIHNGDAGQFDEDHRYEVQATTDRNKLIRKGTVTLAILGILFPVFWVQFLLVVVPLYYTGKMLVEASASKR